MQNINNYVAGLKSTLKVLSFKFIKSFLGEEVVAQYVYASVIGISVVHGRTLIIRTSQGFIIKNLFYFQKPSTKI